MRTNKVLTEMAVERMRPPAAGRVEVFDALLPGFGLRISARGIKSWILFYRVDGKLTRKTLGRYPKLSLADARTEARTIMHQVDRGEDPQIINPARNPNIPMTFGKLAERYIERECKRLKRGAEIESVIRRQMLPKWEVVALRDIRKGDARDLVEDVLDEGKGYAAYRLYETINRVFNWAFEYFDDEELGIETSPVATLKPPIRKSERTRRLSEDEIRSLWLGCNCVGYPFGPLFMLLLLTVLGE